MVMLLDHCNDKDEEIKSALAQIDHDCSILIGEKVEEHLADLKQMENEYSNSPKQLLQKAM